MFLFSHQPLHVGGKTLAFRRIEKTAQKLFQRRGVAALRGAAQPSRQMAALEALKPCLDERRRAKLEKAMGLARAARIARLGLLGTEGENV